MKKVKIFIIQVIKWIIALNMIKNNLCKEKGILIKILYVFKIEIK